MIVFKTNYGDITIELDFDKAPVSSANFLEYARSGFYDNTIFHRVIDNFMIQGGGFDAQMNQKTVGAPIRNEAEKAMSKGVRNAPGYLSMARTNDPHSATAQFFINLVDNRTLDYPSRDGFGYAAFAKVIKGMEVVNGIANVRTGDNGPHQNVPLTPVVIQSVRVIEAQP